jgi:hypothetical protein
MGLCVLTLALAAGVLAIPANKKTATTLLDQKPPYTAESQLSRPRIFGEGIISTVDDEQGGTFSPDGTEFYFTKVAAYTTFPRYSIICVSRFRDGKWSTPEVVSFSGALSGPAAAAFAGRNQDVFRLLSSAGRSQDTGVAHLERGAHAHGLGRAESARSLRHE